MKHNAGKDMLVGGIPTPLKNDGVSNSWDDYSKYIQQVK